MNKKHFRLGLSVFVADSFLGAASIIPMTYNYYCFTDLGKVDVALVTVAMLIVSIISFVWSLFSGAIIQVTKSKYGQFRPWVLIGFIAVLVGGFGMLFYSESMMFTCIVIAGSYLLFTMAMDPAMTGKYGVLEKLSYGDSEIRNLLNGRSFAGTNFAFIIFSWVFLYAVSYFGNGNDLQGFRIVQLFLSAFTFIGIFIYLRLSKPADIDNRSEASEKVERVNLLEMLKSVVVNRCMLAIFIGDVLRYSAYTAFTAMLVYQCKAVLNDMFIYATITSLVSVFGLLGSLIAPKAIDMIGGRKRTSAIFMLIAGSLFIVMAFTGNSVLGLMIPYFAASFFQFASDAVNILLYLDAGEIWYNKTGKDTRAYCMSMQNLTTKIGAIFATLLMGWVLMTINYSEGAVLDQTGKMILTMSNGLLPGATFIIFSLLLLLVHNVSDKELDVIIKENAKKDGFSMYE